MTKEPFSDFYRSNNHMLTFPQIAKPIDIRTE